MAGSREAYERAMRAAMEHSRKRNWQAAYDAYRQAVIEFPQDVAAVLGLGNALREAGQLQRALKAFEQAAQIAPREVRVLSSLADIQERSGMLDAAGATYTRMADAYVKQDKLQQAAESWTRACRLAPDQVEAYRQLAVALERLGRPVQAASEYATLAAVYERRGDKALARETYREALRLDSQNTHFQARLAALEGSPAPEPPATAPQSAEPARAGIEEEAFPFATEAEETAADDSPFETTRRRALQELADTLFAVGSEDGPKPAVAAVIGQAIDQQTRGLADEAIVSLRKALDGGFNRTALFYNLGVLYLERRDYEKAIETFRHSMRDRDFRLGSHYALGLTYQAAGMLDRALEHLLEVVKTVDLQTVSAKQIGKLALAYQKLADGYIAKSDTHKADVFTRTLVSFFSRPRWEQRARQARHDMDQLSSDNGSPMTLAEYLETPETETVVTSLNRIAEYMRRKMLATAIEECLHAIERVPYHLPLYVRLAEIMTAQECHTEAAATSMTVADAYWVRGQIQEAVEICRAVLQQMPMDVRAREKLVALLLDQDEIDQALEQGLALADTYYQLAEVDRALETCDAALRLASKSPSRSRWEISIFRRIGDISIQRVDWVRATWAYESIAAHTPEDDNAQLTLIDLYYKQRQRDKALRSFDRLLAISQKMGKVQRLPEVFRDLVQAHPDELVLRARVAAGYAALGMTGQAVEEYMALSKLQLQAGLQGEASRTFQTLIGLCPERAGDYRRLLAQLQGGSASPAS
jgi:tetratricopeptide (TPR) repeat protein